MRYKHLKLLRNLGNGIEIVVDGAAPELLRRLTAEGEAVLSAAGLDLPPADEVVPGPEPVQVSVPRQGGSTLQSVLRSAGSVETDYLNGEIALLGRLHGVPTPANARIQTLMTDVATRGGGPGELTAAALLAELRG